MDNPFFSSDFSGDVLNFFLFKMMLSVSFLYLAFIMLRHVPCIPVFSRTYIMNRCWILSNTFSACNRWSRSFCTLFYFCGGLCLLIYLYQITLHLWDKVNLIIVEIFYIYSWTQFISISLRTFISMFIKISVYSFLLLLGLYLISTQNNTDFVKLIWKCSFFFYFTN